MRNKVTDLFGIKYPIIQGGMVWCSGWELASAVSNNGGLGLIGSGSMYPEILEQHIIKTQNATSKPFGVNVPLLYPAIEQHIETIIKYKVPIVFTSAGNPKTWTAKLKEAGITVVHVVSSSKFAAKAEAAGVDAVVAEGFEAGGHNGREETTTLTLIPSVRKATNLPLIAAGGIGTGSAIAAVQALGADGVQIGTRFAMSQEASCHSDYKKLLTQLTEGSTQLSLKKLAPVRLVKNKFFEDIFAEEIKGSTPEKLREMLGKGRSKKGMFEGNLDEGELEIGQVSALINTIEPVSTIMQNLVDEYRSTIAKLAHSNF